MPSAIDQKSELRNRVAARKAELEAKVREAMADAQGQARKEAEEARAKLTALKEHLAGGWDNLTEEAASKLNSWLKQS